MFFLLYLPFYYIYYVYYVYDNKNFTLTHGETKLNRRYYTTSDCCVNNGEKQAAV